MSKKVSILSRLKSLFKGNTGTSISRYQSEVEIESYDYSTKREYKPYEHLYVKVFDLDNGGNIEEYLDGPDGYELIKIVDHAGYQIDDLATYRGPAYVLYSNSETVIAKVDEFKVPGGFIASRYAGKPLEKGSKKGK